MLELDSGRARRLLCRRRPLPRRMCHLPMSWHRRRPPLAARTSTDAPTCHPDRPFLVHDISVGLCGCRRSGRRGGGTRSGGRKVLLEDGENVSLQRLGSVRDVSCWRACEDDPEITLYTKRLDFKIRMPLSKSVMVQAREARHERQAWVPGCVTCAPCP